MKDTFKLSIFTARVIVICSVFYAFLGFLSILPVPLQWALCLYLIAGGIFGFNDLHGAVKSLLYALRPGSDRDETPAKDITNVPNLTFNDLKKLNTRK